MGEPLPVFGSKLPGVPYTLRPGAYAVVRDAQGRFALVLEDGDWYLPGGGIEAGETARAALAREVREECGCGVEVREPLAEALEFVRTRSGRLVEVHALYFGAAFVGPTAATWCTADEACARVRRRADAWIIARASEG
jgi:8-oxo-dGTP diphosphatase